MTARAVMTGLAALVVLLAVSDAGASGAAGSRSIGRRRGLGHFDGAKVTLGSRVTPPSEARPAASGQALGSQAASRALGRTAAGSAAVRSGEKPAAGPAVRAPLGARRVLVRRVVRLARPLVPAIEGALPRLSTRAPGLLVVLGDFSTSMRRSFAGQGDVAKADALADVVNGVLADFIDRNNDGGVIRERLDVAVQGYGLGRRKDTSWNGVGPALEGVLAGVPIVSIADLADNPAGEVDVEDEEGFAVPRPYWITPTAIGTTRMRAGFAAMRDVVKGWTRRPDDRHLVLAVHVTDGKSKDGDPSDQVAALAADVRASGGELLMTNIHLSSRARNDGVVFPDDADAERLGEHGQMLFRMSSPVPAALAEKLGTRPGARMMAYNATVEQFARVFEAGSSIAGR